MTATPLRSSRHAAPGVVDCNVTVSEGKGLPGHFTAPVLSRGPARW